MRKIWPLWAFFCFLALSGCGTVATGVKTKPVPRKVRRPNGPRVDLSAYLQRLGGARVDKGKDGVSITIASDSLFEPEGDHVKLSNAVDVGVLAGAGKKYPHTDIEVDVYTDCEHSEEQDLALTELEAWLIKRALVDRGISPRRISAQGWGESRPVATNATAAGRKANRRVTITFEPSNS